MWESQVTLPGTQGSTLHRRRFDNGHIIMESTGAIKNSVTSEVIHLMKYWNDLQEAQLKNQLGWPQMGLEHPPPRHGILWPNNNHKMPYPQQQDLQSRNQGVEVGWGPITILRLCASAPTTLRSVVLEIGMFPLGKPVRVLLSSKMHCGLVNLDLCAHSSKGNIYSLVWVMAMVIMRN